MRHYIATLFGLTILAPSIASAHEFRLEQIPNGGQLDCTLCHNASAGGGPRNVFGMQVENEGLDGEGAIEEQNVVWEQLYDLDADGDGFTNGFELGDPDGTWEFGTEPDFGPSLPQDPESVPCGSGNLHPDEECDGDEYADDATCVSLGFTGGMIACNADCTFDTSGCTGTPDAGMSDMGASADAGSTVPDASSQDMAAATGDTGGSAQEEEEEESSGWGPYYDNPPPPPPEGACAGEIETPDTGADAGMQVGFLLLLVGWFRRRR
jgi:hypothetical protein